MGARKPALAVASIAALLTVVAAYALARIAQDQLSPEPDPALVVWSTRIGMYWRLALGAYAAAIVAPVAYAWAARDLDRACRALAIAVPLIALLITAQGLLVP